MFWFFLGGGGSQGTQNPALNNVVHVSTKFQHKSMNCDNVIITLTVHLYTADNRSCVS